ncbi:breast cancer anti-estrogen resistance protein 1 [Aplochiton taeniatus]
MSVPNVLAKALYDNAAESPDELSFRKGDIMTVLERDTQGLGGWWLCSLHGRQGIVPGNRLKVLVGMYDKQGTAPPTPATPLPRPPMQGGYTRPPPALSSSTTPSPSASQYTAMHPAQDGVYMMPPSHGAKPSQSLYQIPQGPAGPPKAPQLTQKMFHSSGSDIYQVPPSLGQTANQDIYQIPPPAGGSMAGQDIYQVPPSLEKRTWENSKPPGKVVVPTRVGQVYVYDTTEQDEYDVPPRHTGPPQDIYDVPPPRTQYTQQQVYDTPPMAVKGPTSGQDVYDMPPMPVKGPSICQDIYDTPPRPDKKQLASTYDFPPSVSRDVPDRPIRDETYDVPPHFAKLRAGASLHDNQGYRDDEEDNEPPIPEDVYDVPPPLTGKHGAAHHGPPGQDVYDIPASLRAGGRAAAQDVYDFPRERGGPAGAGDSGGARDYIYDVPPQVGRDAAGEEPPLAFKRLSASSTGSSHSASSLETVPVRDSYLAPGAGPGKPLVLDLEQAMERLSRLQQAVQANVSALMAFITGSWRSPAQLEGTLPALRQAAERVRAAVRDFLEFARGAVANAGQATDRSLATKLGRQVGKMEEVFQGLVHHAQALEAVGWALAVLAAPPAGGDDLDRLVMTARGVPDDTKQLASFLHGNASLLFKRTNKQQPQLPLPPLPHELAGHMSGSSSSLAYQSGVPERANIQSRPLPSPPKFSASEEGEAPERPYDTTEEGWMEDYDYVHLQGKEEFEKNQKTLLEKGSISRHNKTHLEHQQLKQFERLEQEVSRPINNDISGWTPPPHPPSANQTARCATSQLCPSDRQLLLFYQEQCEANITTVTNAVDAFFTSVAANQPPKIFVAHSKFVILSAHKLVFIGDTLSRQARAAEVRSRVAQHSNALCDKLKDIVVSTKMAALQYPAPGPARDMTERVRELAGCTQQFRMTLGQLVAM